MPRSALVRATAAVVGALVATSCASAGSSRNPASTPVEAAHSASTTPDPSKLIALDDVDACALLSETTAQTIGGASVSRPPEPSLPASISASFPQMCEYTDAPAKAVSSVEFYAVDADSTPLGSYETAMTMIERACPVVVAAPSIHSPTDTCGVRTVKIAGSLSGYVLYPGRSAADSPAAPPADAGPQLYWWAGGLMFSIATTGDAVDAGSAVPAMEAAADAIARMLA